MTLLSKALKASLASLFLASLATGASAYEQGKTYNYTVLHVNDTHGHFWADENGVGGFAALKTIIDQVKKEKGENNVLVLHSGDYNTGVPESDQLNALPDIVGINTLGFDAVVVGNHEFDVGFAGLEKQKQELKVPLLSANISYTDPKTGKVTLDYFQPYAWLEKGGLKYLIVGTTTPSTKYQSNPDNTAPFTFDDPIKSFKAAVFDAEQKHGKPDVVVSLSHLGYYPFGNHQDNPYGDVTLAKNLPAGLVSLFVTGHTHQFGCVNDGKHLQINQGVEAIAKCTPEVVNGAPIVQAGKWGEYVGRADYQFKDGKSTLVSYKLLPVNAKTRTKDENKKTVYVPQGPEVAQNQQVLDVLKPYFDQGQAKLNVVVGKLTQDLIPSRSTRTKLAYLVAEAYRDITQSDFAVMNSGGVRAPLAAGDLTYKNVLTVLPFKNTLVTARLSGKEVVEYLQGVAFIQEGSGGFPNYAGVTFDRDLDKKTVSNVVINGKPLDENKTYQIALLSFSAKGGDKYPDLSSKGSFVDTGYNDAKAFVDYLAKVGTVDVEKVKVEGPRN